MDGALACEDEDVVHVVVEHLGHVDAAESVEAPAVLEGEGVSDLVELDALGEVVKDEIVELGAQLLREAVREVEGTGEGGHLGFQFLCQKSRILLFLVDVGGDEGEGMATKVHLAPGAGVDEAGEFEGVEGERADSKSEPERETGVPPRLHPLLQLAHEVLEAVAALGQLDLQAAEDGGVQAIQRLHLQPVPAPPVPPQQRVQRHPQLFRHHHPLHNSSIRHFDTLCVLCYSVSPHVPPVIKHAAKRFRALSLSVLLTRILW